MSEAVAEPIVVDDSGSFEVYPSVVDACLNLEVYDVRDGTVRAFDAHGRSLRVETDGYDVVGMTLEDGTRGDPEYLAQELRRTVRTIGASRLGVSDPDALDLQGLLAALLRTAAPPPRGPFGLRRAFGWHRGSADDPIDQGGTEHARGIVRSGTPGVEPGCTLDVERDGTGWHIYVRQPDPTPLDAPVWDVWCDSWDDVVEWSRDWNVEWVN